MIDMSKLAAEMERVGREIHAMEEEGRRTAELVRERREEILRMLERYGRGGFGKVSPQPVLRVAVDGSQAVASEHDGVNAFLVNIAVVFACPHAKTRTVPHVGVFKGSVPREAWVSAVRTVKEIEALRDAIDDLPESERKLLMYDGSLLIWDALLKPLRNRFFEALRGLFETAKAKNACVVGIVSGGRFTELRALVERAIGKSLSPLTDVELLEALGLSPAERTPAFEAEMEPSKLLEGTLGYGISFSYLNVGYEIIRVEFPGCTPVEDVPFGAILESAKTGQGYPLELQHAHSLSSVSSAEREMFIEAMRRRCYRQKMSFKGIRKRRGLI